MGRIMPFGMKINENGHYSQNEKLLKFIDENLNS